MKYAKDFSCALKCVVMVQDGTWPLEGLVLSLLPKQLQLSQRASPKGDMILLMKT